VSLEDRVLAALGTVYDPELDEPLTALGFVASCAVSESGDVDVHLRLPTHQCAPNFAYLMVADARDAVARLPEVGDVTISLDDHMTAAEINGAVVRREGFAGAFPGETTGDLDALRSLFQRKALVARQSRICEKLMRDGLGVEEIVALRLADVPAGTDAARCQELRVQLRLAATPQAPAIVRPDGTPVTAAELPRWLRLARLTRVSLESNGGLCRGLLKTRYGIPDPEEVAA
jgi:metal-sulfur cluster biosynthetic enzyme